MKNNKKELIMIGFLTVLLAAMDIFGLPATLFIHWQIADIDPMYFTLMVNFLLIVGVCFLVIRLFCPDWDMGLEWDGFLPGVKKYGLAGVLALLVSTFAFYIGLKPFDYSPSFAKVLVEGFVYYIGVGLVEELYVRGLLLNLIENLLDGKKNAVLWAVVLSSVIFGLGHIPGSRGLPWFAILSKVVWTIGLGIYFGAIYKKTNCLWVPAFMHTIMDFCGVPFCYSTSSAYPNISLVIILPTYVVLGAYGIYVLKRQK